MEKNLDEQIRLRAYHLWEMDGCPAGREQHYWFAAVTEITAHAMADVPVKKQPRKKAVRAAA